MSRADRVLIAALALLALAAWPLSAAAFDAPGRQVVVTGPIGSSEFALAEAAVIDVAGSRGTVRVEIADGCVRVLASDCPNHTCVNTGPVSTGGSVIACVPNGVVIRVAGGDDDAFDARIR